MRGLVLFLIPWTHSTLPILVKQQKWNNYHIDVCETLVREFKNKPRFGTIGKPERSNYQL
jgi:hypothetical protein